MGVTDTVFGTPGQTQVHQTAGSKPPGFNFARDFFNSLSGIAQNPYPTYQGQIDPGLSPTLQNVIRQAQGYSQSAPPEILAGVQGSLGRFMNPSFMNPVARMQMGVPDYFNQNPNQTVWNGGNVGGLAGVFGAGQPGSKMPGSGPSGGFQVPPSGQPTIGMPGGYQLPNGQMNQTPPFYQGGGMAGALSNVGQSLMGMPGLQTFGSSDLGGGGSQPNGQFPLNPTWPGGGRPPSFDDVDWSHLWGGESRANGQFPLNPSASGGQPGQGPDQPGGGRTFGGYSIQQLQSDPSLAARLGQHAAGLWRAFQPGGGMMGGGSSGPNTMHPPRPGVPMKPNRDPNHGGVAALPPGLK